MSDLDKIADAARQQHAVVRRPPVARGPIAQAEVRLILEREKSGSLSFFFVMAGLLAILATVSLAWWLYQDYQRVQEEAAIKKAVIGLFKPLQQTPPPPPPPLQLSEFYRQMDRQQRTTNSPRPSAYRPAVAPAPVKVWTIEEAVSVHCTWVGSSVNVTAKNAAPRDVVRLRVGVRMKGTDRAFIIVMTDVPAGGSKSRLLEETDILEPFVELPELCVWEGDFAGP